MNRARNIEISLVLDQKSSCVGCISFYLNVTILLGRFRCNVVFQVMVVKVLHVDALDAGESGRVCSQ